MSASTRNGIPLALSRPFLRQSGRRAHSRARVWMSLHAMHWRQLKVERLVEKTQDMRHFKFKRGLDLPVTGAPDQTIHTGPAITQVAVLGRDIIALKPRMIVQEGDDVRRGDPLFVHKDAEEAQIVAR